MMIGRPSNHVEYSLFETDWGWMGLAGSPAGLVAVALPALTREEVATALKGDDSSRSQNEVRFRELARKLSNYLAGKRVVFNDCIDLTMATPFQRNVWTQTQCIPYGKSQSYSWIASHIGKPGASRAVGQALGHNPLPIVVPCHRVVAADGSLGGFSGGLEIKKRLLKLEQIPVQ